MDTQRRVSAFLAKKVAMLVSANTVGSLDRGTIVMQNRIRAVLASQGRMPSDALSVAGDADLYELGLTSHASVNVMLALEDEFDIEFPDDALNKTTFAQIDSIERAVRSLTAPSA